MATELQPAIPSIDAAHLAALIGRDDVHVIDVRLPFDYFGGRIPGAVSLPGTMILERVGQVPPDKKLVFISEDGIQCMEVAAVARAAGFQEVAVLAGGYESWLAEDRPVETISDGFP